MRQSDYDLANEGPVSSSSCAQDHPSFNVGNNRMTNMVIKLSVVHDNLLNAKTGVGCLKQRQELPFRAAG